MSEQSIFIDALERLPEALKNATQGLSQEQLDIPAGKGKWTIRQLAHHIADANINAMTRMKLIVTEEKPILKPYNQDRWAELADCSTGSLESTFSLLKGLHERWVVFLRSLPQTSWTREGIHLENGKVTLFEVLKLYSGHGNSHLQQIIAFRESNKW